MSKIIVLSNRDEARAAIAKAGITTNNVTQYQLDKLHGHVGAAMASSDCYHGTYRINKKKGAMFMTCRSNQWKNREAVSFNPDGFIGFAGWADGTNIVPILNGVASWLAELAVTP